MALADTTGDQQPDAQELERILSELLALEREVVELAYVRRSDSLERAREAVRRLADVGSPQGILSRAPEEFGAASQFDRVLISEVIDRSLRAGAVWSRDDQAGSEAALAALRHQPLALEYPLIEDEVAARQRVEIVDVARSRARAAPRFTAVLGWSSYVVAPLAVHGQTVGLLHADTGAGGRELDALDAEVAGSFAEGPVGRVRARSPARDAAPAPPRAAVGGPVDERAPRTADRRSLRLRASADSRDVSRPQRRR